MWGWTRHGIQAFGISNKNPKSNRNKRIHIEKAELKLFLFIDDTANDGIQAYVGLVERANVAYCFHKYQALVCSYFCPIPMLFRHPVAFGCAETA